MHPSSITITLSEAERATGPNPYGQKKNENIPLFQKQKELQGLIRMDKRRMRILQMKHHKSARLSTYQ